MKDEAEATQELHMDVDHQLSYTPRKARCATFNFSYSSFFGEEYPMFATPTFEESPMYATQTFEELPRYAQLFLAILSCNSVLQFVREVDELMLRLCTLTIFGFDLTN